MPWSLSKPWHTVALLVQPLTPVCHHSTRKPPITHRTKTQANISLLTWLFLWGRWGGAVWLIFPVYSLLLTPQVIKFVNILKKMSPSCSTQGWLTRGASSLWFKVAFPSVYAISKGTEVCEKQAHPTEEVEMQAPYTQGWCRAGQRKVQFMDHMRSSIYSWGCGLKSSISTTNFDASSNEPDNVTVMITCSKAVPLVETDFRWFSVCASKLLYTVQTPSSAAIPVPSPWEPTGRLDGDIPPLLFIVIVSSSIQ